jgi:hypothetical protein
LNPQILAIENHKFPVACLNTETRRAFDHSDNGCWRFTLRGFIFLTNKDRTHGKYRSFFGDLTICEFVSIDVAKGDIVPLFVGARRQLAGLVILRNDTLDTLPCFGK